ncbi:GNAT family N-acetyltransferase [Parerythrobacter lacustris]|uniref:GNAT family N-acetyltransferase n=1 Tax=Parerythrobacter lacustris TaxID=2969984 RepID=A0ABT1XS19_9SPHN|nr:GNAT family N-acetyltransferase [Parerythrobacter lacustris]MCR2834440.1 GNAT family N-acetyltransferase [Parerythrobacter lacustris]
MADGFRLETARLVLRDWSEEDWPEFFRVTNTSAVMRWLGGVLDEDGEAKQRARVEACQAANRFCFWAVERRDDGAILGFCGLKRSNQPGGPMGLMEVGWRFREDCWGQGFAKEAATAALDAAFELFGADEVVAFTVRRNISSWGLMKRLGMRRREDLDFASADFDAEDPTMIVYSTGKDEWGAP